MWGGFYLFGTFGVTLENNPWLYVPFMLGGWSPTIVSYIVLKRNNRISGFKEWLKNVFNVKSRPSFYVLTFFLLVLCIVPNILISGLNGQVAPLYMLFVFIPMMTVGGGLEEAGWRYVLQPELDKKFGFIITSAVIGVIWACWHLPLLYTPGTGQEGFNFLWYFIGVMGLSFALGAIIKITGNVFLCVLFHCLINVSAAMFPVNQTFWGNAVPAVLVTVASIAAVFVYEKKKNIVNI